MFLCMETEFVSRLYKKSGGSEVCFSPERPDVADEEAEEAEGEKDPDDREPVDLRHFLLAAIRQRRTNSSAGNRLRRQTPRCISRTIRIFSFIFSH